MNCTPPTSRKNRAPPNVRSSPERRRESTRMKTATALLLFLLCAPHPVHAGNAPVGGGGSCSYSLAFDGTVGQQQAYDNGLYTCLSGGTWAAQGFIVGNTLASGTSATTSCTTAYHGMLEYTSGAFEYCTGTTWTAFSSYTPVSGTVGDGTGVIVELSAGTAAAPSLTFHTDTTTGLYQPTTHTMAVTTAGTERVAFDSSGDFNLVGAHAQYQLDSNPILTVPAADTVYSLAIGNDALLYDSHSTSTTGEYNLAVGYYTLPGTATTPMTGADNAIAGAGAGQDVSSTPSFTTAVGSGSFGNCCSYLSNVPGNYNTAIGAAALQEGISNYGGAITDNTMAGASACSGPGYGVTNSVMIGANAGGGCGGTASTTATIDIGNATLVNYNGNTAGDIVIGSTNTAANLAGTDDISISASNFQGADVTGSQNIAFGGDALENLSTGSSNTAIGNGALGSQAGSADTNTALGANAQGGMYPYNSTGGYNLAIGSSALGNNITGSNNTAIGNGAIEGVYGAGSVGSDNTGLGQAALADLQGVSATPLLASDNTAAGASAGQNITSGYYNTAIGNEAMLGVANTPLTGQSNTAVGYEALYNLQGTATNDTAFGASAGYNLTTGTDNTLIGYEAGVAVTGNYNIVLGEDTSSTLTTGSSNIWIGNNLSQITGSSNSQIDIADNIMVYGDTHLAMHGTAPTIGNCPTSTTGASVVGNDNAMVIQQGSGATSTTLCTLTFHTAWTSTPICTASWGTNAAPPASFLSVVFTSPQTLTIYGSVAEHSDKINVICQGYK
jgi:trimeric autotransporter adhesin